MSDTGKQKSTSEKEGTQDGGSQDQNSSSKKTVVTTAPQEEGAPQDPNTDKEGADTNITIEKPPKNPKYTKEEL